MSNFVNIDSGKILKAILKNGGEYADIYCQRSYATSIICEDDKIEKVISGRDLGVGLRLIKNHRTAYAYTNDTEEAALLSIADDLSGALSKAGNSPGDITLEALKPCFSQKIKIDPADVDIERKIGAVVEANEAARGEKQVSQVKVVYRDGTNEILTANSFGSVTNEKRTGSVFLAQVVVTDGESIQTGYEPIGGAVGFELFDERSPAEVALIAANRARLMLKADRAPGGTMTVVLSSEAGGTMIHEAVGHGLEADLASKKLSVYSGRLGEKVASELITVIDDSTIPNKRGSFLFDDEGTPSSKTILVDGGTLVSFMYDNLSAIREGKESTGNGRRESYRQKPIPRMTNTMIAPGKSDPKEILSSVNRGLLVKKMGGGQVNTVNGQFVFEVSEGYMIEGGVVGPPVRGAILTGSGPQVLMEIDMVGNDLGYGIGTCGKDGQGVPVSDAQPTLRIPSITLGGKV
ncbi:MAG: TldD/PmbA family protein [Deltaproteobacteria bacterium]|uniref:TldD/PmbA family protein n=1 Tax=Candidatus Zymogenus saltonus TaxID=2844893 RepID=A0A9D8KF37_9DELT|nr:TldD/PmbA family protein [Candidatus Zymogenus saltonus]